MRDTLRHILCIPAVCIAVFLCGGSLHAQQPVIDGYFADWDDVPVLHEDPGGDGRVVDFRVLKAAVDEDWFYLYFETTTVISPQEGNRMRLFLDTDNDASTGQGIHGIGAELAWYFGDRRGVVTGNATGAVSHADLRYIPAPTVTSDRFELAFSRHARPLGNVLFPGLQLRIVLHDAVSGGDRQPDENGGVYFRFENEFPAAPAADLLPQAAGTVRLLTWNVLQGGLLDEERQEHFTRIIAAVKPDVFCFQECFDLTAGQVLLYVRSVLDAPDGRSWRVVKVDAGNVLVTHLDIIQSQRVQSAYRQSAHLLRARSGDEFLLVNCHLRCCSADEERQEEADGLIAYIRDTRAGRTGINMRDGIPIILTGDFNLVGDHRQLETLLHGSIMDTLRYGAPHAPDWNGDSFRDLVSRRPSTLHSHTWENAESAFAPARIDYTLYTGSVMRVEQDMIFDTRELTPQQRERFGVEADDALLASDHLPRVADLRLGVVSEVAGTDAVATTLVLWPNPAGDAVLLRRDGGVIHGDVLVHDMLGRVRLRVPGAGRSTVRLSLAGLARGTYVVSVPADRELRPMLLHRR